MTRPDTARIARELATRGYRVFPLPYAEKVPVVKWKDLTVNPMTEQEIARYFPAGQPSNIGIATGPSGLVVLDEDTAGAIASLEAEHGHTLPDTYEVNTGRGRHVYFAFSGGDVRNSASKLRPGLDVRAAGGYVLAEGSTHPSGDLYVGNGKPVAPLPSWLHKLLTADKKVTTLGTASATTSGRLNMRLGIAIPEGQRHDHFVRLAGVYRGKDLPLAEAEMLISAHWNNCQQPPEAQWEFPIADAHRILQDIYKRPPGKPVTEGRARRARLTSAADIEPAPVKWAWKDNGAGRIPAGSLFVSAGREGTGKSSFGIWLTAAITQGKLPGAFEGTPRNVFYVAVEDSWKYTLVPRLIAAGADLDKVKRFEVVSNEDEELTLSLPHDNDLLEEAINDADAALVVIDPLMSVMGEKIDTHRNREVRTALDPLVRIADRTGCMVGGIAHFNKGNGTDAASLISGSGAFKDVPRAVFGFARDDESETRVLTQVKNSLGRDTLPSLSYTIETASFDTRLGLIETGKLVWLGESDRSVEEILRSAGRRADDTGDDHNPCQRWLLKFIEDNGDDAGEVDASDTIAKAEGTFTKDEVINARRRCKNPKILTRKVGFGKQSRTLWRIDAKDAMNAKDAKAGEVAAKAASTETDALVPDAEAVAVKTLSTIDAIDVTTDAKPENVASMASMQTSESFVALKCDLLGRPPTEPAVIVTASDIEKAAILCRVLGHGVLTTQQAQGRYKKWKRTGNVTSPPRPAPFGHSCAREPYSADWV